MTSRYRVEISGKVQKQLRKLSKKIHDTLQALMKDIEVYGPVAGKWPNYGKLGENRHHCHLKTGNPTYVAVWETTDKTARIVEVIYVGTHEKAPY